MTQGFRSEQPSPLAVRISQSMTNNSKYLTTTESCSCPDYHYRKHVCKHMQQMRNENAVNELREFF